jgi:Leucine-rich repeat (LRR) protein
MTHFKPLFELDMSSNKMESIEGCSNLINLVKLDLSQNLIENIDLFNQSSSPIQRSRDLLI